MPLSAGQYLGFGYSLYGVIPFEKLRDTPDVENFYFKRSKPKKNEIMTLNGTGSDLLNREYSIIFIIMRKY